ncbi:MAG: site-2 protease family protein [Candidatus Margulisbacteria bacterium]|jgi:Zn-dependent protease|nr:site-2 protease family protein [Candidatus Margulisiibacteriota bacterium]
MRSSVKLLTVFRIPVEINYSWLIIFGLVLSTLAANFSADFPGLSGPVHWLLAFLTAILFFVSILAHELSHAVVALRAGLPIHGITLFIFGGVAQLGEEPENPGVELRMALAGPAMSFLLAALFYVLGQIMMQLGAPLYLAKIALYLLTINVLLGVFNLLPGFPLDGGRVLRALLWQLTGNLRRATGIAAFGGKALAVTLMLAGIFLFFRSYYFNGLWYIFIGFFLLEAADASYRQVALKKLLSGVRVGQIMTQNVITVPADLPLSRLVEDYFFRFRFAAFPVVADDRLIGLLTFHAIKEIERERWSAVTAREAMIPITTRLTIDRHAELTTALARLAASGSGRLLVMEGDKLIGILSQRDIMSLFEYKAEVDK